MEGVKNSTGFLFRNENILNAQLLMKGDFSNKCSSSIRRDNSSTDMSYELNDEFVKVRENEYIMEHKKKRQIKITNLSPPDLCGLS